MVQPFVSALYLLAIGAVLFMTFRKAWGPDQLLGLVWAAFAIAILSYGIYGLSEGRFVFVSWVFGILSSVTCGLAWLLSRTLFRSSDKLEKWPFIIVGVLLLTGLATDLLDHLDMAQTLNGILMTVHTLLSSMVLLMALIEPLIGLPKTIRQSEKTFRLAYAGGYALIFAIGYIWIRSVADGDAVLRWAGEIRLACAMTALVAGGLAVWYRIRHPYIAKFRNGASGEDEAHLAERIRSTLLDDDRFTQSDLKVADIAQMLGAGEHKVSRAITSRLGFTNFNRLVNHYRIDRAQVMLRDPDCKSLPVLTIAMDCGFGSIGPFNRAFKEATGMTPTAWRQAAG